MGPSHTIHHLTHHVELFFFFFFLKSPVSVIVLLLSLLYGLNLCFFFLPRTLVTINTDIKATYSIHIILPHDNEPHFHHQTDHL